MASGDVGLQPVCNPTSQHHHAPLPSMWAVVFSAADFFDLWVKVTVDVALDGNAGVIQPLLNDTSSKRVSRLTDACPSFSEISAQPRSQGFIEYVPGLIRALRSPTEHVAALNQFGGNVRAGQLRELQAHVREIA